LDDGEEDGFAEGELVEGVVVGSGSRGSGFSVVLDGEFEVVIEQGKHLLGGAGIEGLAKVGF
jgi:hypothetical protein